MSQQMVKGCIGLKLADEIHDPLTHYAKSTEACGLHCDKIIFSVQDLPIEVMGPDGRPNAESTTPKCFSTYEDALAELARQNAKEDRELDR